MSGTLQVTNVRLGFATNSSSSHSIIIMNRPLYSHEKEEIRDTTYSSPWNFDWEPFLLVSKHLKARYLLAQVKKALLKQGLSSEQTLQVLQELLGDYYEAYGPTPENLTKMKEEFLHYAERYADSVAEIESFHPDSRQEDIETFLRRVDKVDIDHQSLLSLPELSDINKFPQFIKAFAEVLTSDTTIIRGGNDNSHDDFPYIPGNPLAYSEQFTDLSFNNKIRLRQDGDNWVIFNSNNGAKLRLSLDLREKTTYTKAVAPELVDVKITDFCNSGCTYCYQASTPRGKHVPRENLLPLWKTLRELSVFEVALGGGEPTTHPEFLGILQDIDDHGIVANFSTNTDSWLNNSDLCEWLASHPGGIGVSLRGNDVEKVERIHTYFQHDRHTNRSVMAQLVFGALTESVMLNTIQTLRQKRIPLLLLGYKSVGRGERWLPTSYSDSFIEVLRLVFTLGQDRIRWSVDTAMLKVCENLNLPVKQLLQCPQEGTFSCYVDMVESKVAASSFSDEGYNWKPGNTEQFTEIWQKF